MNRMTTTPIVAASASALALASAALAAKQLPPLLDEPRIPASARFPLEPTEPWVPMHLAGVTSTPLPGASMPAGLLGAILGTANEPATDSTTGTTATPPGAAPGAAHSHSPLSTEALAKLSQNPVANLISVPFQYSANFGFGADEDVQSVLNIQPVIPFDLGENWNLITRTILPIVYQPAPFPGMSDEFGLGDITFTTFLSPEAEEGFIWGAGPAFLIPTATASTLGQGKFGIGPSVVAVYSKGPWVVGALANNIWSVAGSEGRPDVSQMLVQPFVNYNLPGGWCITSSPIITANWEADSSNTWTVPLGGGFGRSCIWATCR